MRTRARIVHRALDYLDQSPFTDFEWCGRFVVKVLQDCGLARDMRCTGDNCGAELCSTLTLTKHPLPGDMCQMGNHFGIFVGMTYSGEYARLTLSKMMADSDVVTIDGGTGDDRVYMARRQLHPRTLFFSIESLIKE